MGQGLGVGLGLAHQQWREKGPTGYRFLFFGASLTDAALADVPAYKAAIDALYGSDVQVVSHAESGSTSADMAADITGYLDLYPDAAADGVATYCVIECGGADVNDNRPYANHLTAAAALASNLGAVVTAIQAKGFTAVVSDLSFRDYNDTTYAKEQNGTRPFNQNVIRPLVRPDWKYASGRPLLQVYDVIRNGYGAFLQADNIHLTAAGYQAIREHWRDTVFRKVLTGANPVEIAPDNGVTAKLHVHGDVATITEPAGWTGFGEEVSNATLLDADGVRSTGWAVQSVQAFQGQTSSGQQTGNNTGVVPDKVLQNGLFVDQTSGPGYGKFEVQNLDPNRLYDLLVVGSRGGVGDSRITRYTVNDNPAGAQTLECANNTANGASFTGVSPDSNGKITIRVDRTNHQFGYINAVVLSMRAG